MSAVKEEKKKTGLFAGGTLLLDFLLSRLLCPRGHYFLQQVSG